MLLSVGLQCLASTQLGVCPFFFNLISGAHCPLPSKENMLSSWTDKNPLGFWEDYRHMKQKSFDLFCIMGLSLVHQTRHKGVTLFWRRKKIKIASFFFKFKKCCRWDEFCVTFFFVTLHTFFTFCQWLLLFFWVFFFNLVSGLGTWGGERKLGGPSETGLQK